VFDCGVLGLAQAWAGWVHVAFIVDVFTRRIIA
jgi:hypothetical protein